jgi:hypothetical protein
VIGVSLLPDETMEAEKQLICPAKRHGGRMETREREVERAKGALLLCLREVERLSSVLHSMSLVLYVVCKNQYMHFINFVLPVSILFW